jgi:hypothetical protein
MTVHTTCICVLMVMSGHDLVLGVLVFWCENCGTLPVQSADARHTPREAIPKWRTPLSPHRYSSSVTNARKSIDMSYTGHSFLIYSGTLGFKHQQGVSMPGIDGMPSTALGRTTHKPNLEYGGLSTTIDMYKQISNSMLKKLHLTTAGSTAMLTSP